VKQSGEADLAWCRIPLLKNNRPWPLLQDAPFDLIEDSLHSFTWTAMGFALALGALARLVQRSKQQESGRTFDTAALLAATAIPLSMIALPDIDGLLQRVMFLVAYLWCTREALRISG
jgi:hypothetical protein